MEFRRARRPEQVAARRVAILDTAEAMLGEVPVTEVSLRELSCRVGLAKSNVLRYFDSREAVFLGVLDRRWAAWLDDVEGAIREARVEGVPYGRAIAVATALAESVGRHALLCDLVASMAGVLERNIGLDTARAVKARATDHTARLADLVRAELPQLDEPAATRFARSVLVVIAGLWPHAQPTDEVARASAELGLPPAAELFATDLREALVNQLIGLVVRAS
ncbi:MULTISPECIES: TetR/AcrR family transcriptional regulator [unclassified Saccharothrix]|uniref:TetR/AcrR family transcriptional regulator n=1 Tax=unclassified Saccharothrix TaxID=2593673 RepID=UPI00307F4078